ncbi:MAG: hypothetical protein NUV50_10225 [Rhodospirillales bacterium]|nr:hypothetical protein [Rhodospirillales bacterium]
MDDDPNRKPILRVIKGGLPDGTLAPPRSFVQVILGWEKFPIIKQTDPKQDVSD